jgi:hypothetical protein
MKPFVPSILLLWLAVAGAAVPQTTSPPTLSPPLDLSKFRSWKRVTDYPYSIDASAAMLCVGWPGLDDLMDRLPEPDRERERLRINDPDSHGTHWNYFVHVYVNETGKPAMRRNGGAFPVGSVVVKEKFPILLERNRKPILKSPIAITVMRKREAGFDTKNGDWEYFVVHPKTLEAKVVIGQTLSSCQSCHANYRDRDFITKAYLLTGNDMYQAMRRRAKQYQPRR